MPFDSSAIATTARNRATYLVKSRLRIFPSAGLVCAAGAAFAAGAAAKLRPSEAAGWREVLIATSLARLAVFVSGSGFDLPAGQGAKALLARRGPSGGAKVNLVPSDWRSAPGGLPVSSLGGRSAGICAWSWSENQLIRHEPPFPVVAHELRRALVGKLEELFGIAVRRHPQEAGKVMLEPARGQKQHVDAFIDILDDDVAAGGDACGRAGAGDQGSVFVD